LRNFAVEEGMASLGDQFSASYKDITWEDEGPALQLSCKILKIVKHKS